MTKIEANSWYLALAESSFDFVGDPEGAAFSDEWAYLLAEFIWDMPIQRKPY